ncbi:MAG: hypothetical protein NZ820_10445, partial [Dehalococcoidia bacterium]|nr:hypothetical protein [Dehalococcoidia bacterium]
VDNLILFKVFIFLSGSIGFDQLDGRFIPAGHKKTFESAQTILRSFFEEFCSHPRQVTSSIHRRNLTSFC